MAELIIDFNLNKSLEEIFSKDIYSEMLNNMFLRVQEEENSEKVDLYFLKKQAEVQKIMSYSVCSIPDKIYNSRR